eukprot:673264-Prorocentrum_minimum.AAC.1
MTRRELRTSKTLKRAVCSTPGHGNVRGAGTPAGGHGGPALVRASCGSGRRLQRQLQLLRLVLVCRHRLQVRGADEMMQWGSIGQV